MKRGFSMRQSAAALALAGAALACGGIHAQSMPYVDADSAAEAMGMMKMTIMLATETRSGCISRWPEMQQTIDEQLSTWKRQDEHEINVAESGFAQLAQQNPALAERFETMAKSAFEMRLIKPMEGIDPALQKKVLRDYCKQHFDDLASGVWRQRTPKVYGFLR